MGRAAALICHSPSSSPFPFLPSAYDVKPFSTSPTPTSKLLVPESVRGGGGGRTARERACASLEMKDPRHGKGEGWTRFRAGEMITGVL